MKTLDVGLILLAAGASTRLGPAGSKQLLNYQGKTLLRHAGEMAFASACRPLVAVTGSDADRIAQQLNGLSFKTIYNPAWPDGIGTSIRAGIHALKELAIVDAVIVMLCDQPLLTAHHLNLLIETASQNNSKIVASEYSGTAGVPALFSRLLFDELMNLPDDEGARKLIQRHKNDTILVPLKGGEIDIDTIEAYEKLM